MKRYMSLAAVVLAAATLSARAEVSIVGEITPNGDGTFANVVLTSDEKYEAGKTVTFYVNGSAIANAAPPAAGAADLPFYSTLWTPPALQGQVTVNEVIETQGGARKISPGIRVFLDQEQGIPVPVTTLTEFTTNPKKKLSTRNAAVTDPIFFKFDATLSDADLLDPETSLNTAVPSSSLESAVIGSTTALGGLCRVNTGATTPFGSSASGTALAVGRATTGSKTAGWINTNSISFFESTAVRVTNVIEEVRVPRVLETSTKLAVAPPRRRPVVGFYVYSFLATESLSSFGGTDFVSSKAYRFQGGDFSGPRVKVSLGNDEFIAAADQVSVRAEDPSGVLRIQFRAENSPLSTVVDTVTQESVPFQSRNWSTLTRGGKGQLLGSLVTGSAVGVDRTVVVAFRAQDIYGNSGPVVLRRYFVE